ncbi:hypothetical protein L249_3647 [Ophiocordyceps polyrhachis-furcata BCC 54312]|uniref:Uncharacterized protein n=1 Tax=Ophiocordyceps polyrhachis-furcata BCC 54312 TaxID=1330021 RepID=A0A367L4J5_9HYPO|nr:hypothetical protein L249_3647 [Ophiocordyceps polyrhachis-furcata BCC 54312]
MPAVKESVLGRDDDGGGGSRTPLDIIDIRSRVEVRNIDLRAEITYLDEYYLTNYEMGLLKQSAAELAGSIASGSMLVELGSGNLRKVSILLQAFEQLAKPVDYYALDLSKQELERTLAHLPPFEHVSCHGLLGTYDDGREWLKRPEMLRRPKCILHIGSSIGNFSRVDAAEFLDGFAELLNPGRDCMLLGVDSCNVPAKVHHAYNDEDGITHEFILNGLTHANNLFGKAVFDVAEWRVIGEYVYDDEGGRHQAFIAPVRETEVLGVVIRPHERVQIEQSLKYDERERLRLWKQAGLREEASWLRGDEYGLHLLRRDSLPFPRNPGLYAATVLPTIAEWESIWKVWDVATCSMLSSDQVSKRPIDLRNPCVFYLGHIPTFLDLQLSRATGTASTEPNSFATVFERGIDPDVDDPRRCHAHSAVPDCWPPFDDILAYRDRVRDRVRRLYAEAQGKLPRHVARAVWVGFEHELLHLETLLYMLIQADDTLPPPDAPRPDFELLAEKAARERVPNLWFDVPAQTLVVGMDDPEHGTDQSLPFGWDNEKPSRSVPVHAFQAQGRPITNEDYARFLYNSGIEQVPASWSCVEDLPAATTGAVHSTLPGSFLRGKAVRTVYGLVPLAQALDWPACASYDELARCASWMGGRIPTADETRSIYAYVEAQKKEASTQSRLSKKVPAVNGHLVNDGVTETPPSTDAMSQLHVDLGGVNVGFRHWHPVPVTSRGGSLAGQADMGGLWEWTSSPLRRHPGFEPMSLYPAYTADFFDDKHNIVLGGSWATHPRIAGRKSFVNWYQRNYPYVWAGARLVRDIQ